MNIIEKALHKIKVYLEIKNMVKGYRKLRISYLNPNFKVSDIEREETLRHIDKTLEHYKVGINKFKLSAKECVYLVLCIIIPLLIITFLMVKYL